ncbi:MAG: response regulator, partial [Proteobacteria bacterium]
MLVIEDDENIRDALAEILEYEGYVVKLAGNGREGLDRLAEGKAPDLILLDLMMPVM